MKVLKEVTQKQRLALKEVNKEILFVASSALSVTASATVLCGNASKKTTLVRCYDASSW